MAPIVLDKPGRKRSEKTATRVPPSCAAPTFTDDASKTKKRRRQRRRRETHPPFDSTTVEYLPNHDRENPDATPYLDGGHEVLEHLAGPLLDLDRELGRPVHEDRDLTELGLLHATGGKGGGADADASRGHGRPVTLEYGKSNVTIKRKGGDRSTQCTAPPQIAVR